MAEEQLGALLNRALMRLSRRAEKADPQRLIQTFVNVGPLFDLLSIPDHQVMFGRRGTGKTHAFQFLAGSVQEKGDIPTYSDLSNLGSSGGIYSNPDIPLSERASRLLVDTLLDIHENLLEAFVVNSEKYDLSQTGPLLDALAEAVTDVRVIGTVEEERTARLSKMEKTKSGAEVAISDLGLKASLSISTTDGANQESTDKRKVMGSERHRVHFGAIRRVLEQIAQVVKPHQIWILLDEWSSIPLELQPFLADLLRRSIFPVRNITVKIAAIEYRSRFQLFIAPGDYIGIEVGADVSADINLDDFMVFDNDQTRAREFFKALFHKHLMASDIIIGTHIANFSQDQMIGAGFTQLTAFDELVRAAEGVPRDAIHIASLSSQYAMHDRISVPNVRRAAKNWYQTGKEASVHSREQAMALLHWIIDKVIGERKARAFLLRSNVKHPLIEDLFDSRILHLLKRGISTHDEPGARYDAYKLDYGCYVDLMATSRAPQGLFQVDIADDISEYVEVPKDDYRSIRRAILNLQEFDESQ
jgi:hypothetical protein